jgi:hypothetical protein
MTQKKDSSGTSTPQGGPPSQTEPLTRQINEGSISVENQVPVISNTLAPPPEPPSPPQKK